MSARYGRRKVWIHYPPLSKAAYEGVIRLEVRRKKAKRLSRLFLLPSDLFALRPDPILSVLRQLGTKLSIPLLFTVPCFS